MARPHSLTPAGIRIQARDIRHEFDSHIPRFWANANPVLTAFYNALSTVIPAGEKFFMQSVRDVMPQIDDEQLRADVKGFFAQEGRHRSEHESLNDWIRSQGYPLQKYDGCIQRLLNFMNRWFPARHCLASTLALEHLSALLTDEYLRNPGVRENLHPAMQRFFVWHSIEENEHKGVPFDVYQQVSGSYWVRIVQMLLTTVLFGFAIAFIQARYLWHDRQFFNLKAWIGATGYFLISPAWFLRTVPGYLRYFKPGFHPWQHDNSQLIQQWITRLEQQDTVIPRC